MKYGSCFIGAIVLMFKLKTLKIRIHQRHRFDPPHFYVITSDGVKWHYGVVEEILPKPFGWMIYKGEFRPMKKRLNQIK